MLPRSLKMFLALALTASGLVVPQSGASASVQAAPGIAHRSTTSGGITTPGTSLALAKPAGTVAGDVLVAQVANRDNVATTLTPPAGWTQANVKASAGLLKSWVFTRVAGAAEPASYTFTLSAAYRMAGTISAFSGVDNLRPVDTIDALVNGNTGTFTGKPVTVASGNALAVWFGVQLWSGSACPSPGITQPAGFTEAREDCLISPANGLLYDAAYSQLGTPLAQPAWTGSSPFANTNITQSLALRPAGAPIAHRATTSANANNVTSLALTKPAGTVAGDVLLARVTNRNSVTATITAPAGWTLVNEKQTSYSLHNWIFSRVATSSEPASYSFGFSTALYLSGSLSAFSGVDTARPVDDRDGQYNSSSATFTLPFLTTAVDGEYGVWFGTQVTTANPCPASSVTPPPGFTEVLDGCLASSSTGIGYNVAVSQLGLAGDQPVWTGSSAVAASNLTQAVTLRPAAAVQVADTYASAPVTVGNLWDGLNPDGSKNTAIAQSVLYQPSGLAASRINPNVQYLHSEKDRQTMVAVNTGTAQVVGKYTVTIPNVFDWEDIATGPCPAGTCFFAGDIGTARDIPKPNGTSSVVRVKEPDLAAGETSGTLTGDYFPYTMPGGPKNAEALLVHPVTGDIYVITKAESGISDVYKFPNPLPAPGTSSLLTKVATLTLPTLAGDINYAQLTAASIHPASNRFLVRTYRKVYEYRGTPGGSFESALTGTRVDLTDTSEGQGESIEYAADGSGYFTVSEATAAPYALKRVDRR
ncbi:hypothetical protein AB0P21_22635 [Kribbella sp. NPDC056861]|uniref:hypothetical protein n=1 Tax=Kribbella sp. NPDC056861 TaxID=3154857 RepID=UPI0034289061